MVCRRWAEKKLWFKWAPAKKGQGGWKRRDPEKEAGQINRVRWATLGQVRGGVEQKAEWGEPKPPGENAGGASKGELKWEPTTFLRKDLKMGIWYGAGTGNCFPQKKNISQLKIKLFFANSQIVQKKHRRKILRGNGPILA